MNEDKWINIDEAADYLGVNKDTIRNWIKKESEIPAHKIGKQWKFKKSELDTWVKSGKSAINQTVESQNIVIESETRSFGQYYLVGIYISIVAYFRLVC